MYELEIGRHVYKPNQRVRAMQNAEILTAGTNSAINKKRFIFTHNNVSTKYSGSITEYACVVRVLLA